MGRGDDRPKQCINSKCTNTFYTHKNKLHQPLQCEQCINKDTVEPWWDGVKAYSRIKAMRP